MSAQRKKQPAAPEHVPSRLDRVLATMSLGIVVVSIVCFFAIMIGTAVGLKQGDFTQGAWPMVTLFPLIGLPVAMLMILGLLISSFVRRSRTAKG